MFRASRFCAFVRSRPRQKIVSFVKEEIVIGQITVEFNKIRVYCFGREQNKWKRRSVNNIYNDIVDKAIVRWASVAGFTTKYVLVIVASPSYLWVFFTLDVVKDFYYSTGLIVT